jgi:hypothetical protein
MDIEQKLVELKQAREDSDRYHAGMKEVIELAKQLSKYEALQDLAQGADNVIETLEEEIKLKALEEYNGTKNKNPFAQVTIKIFKTFKIVDVERVKEWAWNNLPAAFKLDEAKIKTSEL